MTRYKSPQHRIFCYVNNTLLVLLAVLCLVPMIHILAVSLSSKAAANANLVGLWPVDFTLDSYLKTIGNRNFVDAMITSFLRTGLGTVLGMLLVCLAAYPLSKENKSFRQRGFYSWFFIITMVFSGGLIPSYIVVQKLGLINSLWALILPGIVNTWLIILMMNFFKTIPKELEESAHMDGADPFTVLGRIYLPLALPSVATIALFMMVGHWNSWFDGLIYINDAKGYPLSTLLQTIIVQQDFTKITPDAATMENLSQRAVKASQIFIGAAPILLVYPFLQRYFVKGIVIGAVKE